jgi:hypothetical protein
LDALLDRTKFVRACNPVYLPTVVADAVVMSDCGCEAIRLTEYVAAS